VKAEFAFSRLEYLARIERVRSVLEAEACDVCVALLPESITYLTGFYTRGYASFQAAVIASNGDPFIVCRDVEEFHLARTSPFADAVLWTDADDPIAKAATAIKTRLGRVQRLGIERSAWTLSAPVFEKLIAALDPVAWIDISFPLLRLRLRKTPNEIAYQRRAAAAAEAGMRAAITASVAGASERDVAAAICTAMIGAGSDTPGPGVLASGEAAQHLHGSYGDRVLTMGDLVQVETTSQVCNYHARFMRPIRVARATDDDFRVAETLIAIQNRALAEVGPGVASAVPDGIYREGILSARLRRSYTNKTFYSIGLMIPPTTGEALHAVAGSDWRFETGMVFHTYILARGIGMSETIAVTDSGMERLTNFPRQLFVS
jgi:Xaa-Pro dipeptidase